MRSRLLLLAILATCVLLLSPSVVHADPDIRYQMLVNAQIDGYPTDDDTIAISRYLTAVGDRQMDVPDAIANWIISRIGHLGPAATPRLTAAYMHFLRKGVLTPPFDGGAAGSPRNRLLLAMTRDLQSRHTPLANLALLMFAESNDAAQQSIQAAADYSPLRSIPWAIGHADWMDWMRVGLRPDKLQDLTQPTDDSKPSWASDFPVVSDLAKAGLLRKVQTFLSGVDVRSPVSESAMNFIDFMDSNSHSWGHLGHSPASAPDRAQMVKQGSALAILLSHRYATTFGLPPVADDDVSDGVSVSYNLGADLERPAHFAGLYSTALDLPDRLNFRLYRLSNVIFSQQFRLLSLAALALVEYQRSHHDGAYDIPMDAVFAQLAATSIPASESKTTVVASLDPADVQAADLVHPAGLSQCNTKSASVVRRQVSIKDRKFVEVIEAACTGGTVRFTKSGILATDFARLLEVNPNFLDILKLSLSVRDLTASDFARREDPDDVDLVRVNPQLGAALGVAALAHPEMPWAFVRDALLQGWPPAIEWLVPGWRPPSAGLQQFALPMQVVSLAGSDFQARQTAVFQRQMNYLQFESQWRYFHAVAPMVNAMKAVENHCANPIFELLSLGASCGGLAGSSTDTGKNALVAQLDAIGAQANSVGQNSESLLFPHCVAARDHAHDARLVAIDPDTQQFASTYITGWCDFPAGGKVDLPQPWKDWLKLALQQDPIFLNRYQLDILGSSDGGNTQLLAALVYASQEATMASKLLNFLQATDLLYYLPSLPVPTPSPDWWDTSASKQQFEALLATSPLDAAAAPLLRSQEGKALAQDLVVLQRLKSAMPMQPESKQRDITDLFMASARTAEQNLLAGIYRNVDEQVNNFKSNMNAKANQIVVGFSLSVGAGTVPGLFFQYNGVGVNATFSLPNVVFVAPTLGQLQLPAYPMILSSPAPGAPNVSSPALANAQPPDLSSPVPAAPNVNSPALANAQPPDFSQGAPLQAVMAAAEHPAFNILASYPKLDWRSLLLNSNFVGRSWLTNQIKIATPVLTQDEINQITGALQKSTFPLDLANLVAAKAAQASFSTFDASIGALLTNKTVADACKNETWSTCALAVKLALDNHPGTPADVAGLAGLAVLWGSAYDAQYDFLRKKGRLERSTSDSEKFYEAVRSKIDPREIAKDHVEDAVLQWVLSFAKLGFVLEWVKHPYVEALKQLFESSQFATDFDQLRLADGIIQEEVMQQLAPYLKPDWNFQLSQAVDQSAPQWRAGP